MALFAAAAAASASVAAPRSPPSLVFPSAALRRATTHNPNDEAYHARSHPDPDIDALSPSFCFTPAPEPLGTRLLSTQPDVGSLHWERRPQLDPL